MKTKLFLCNMCFIILLFACSPLALVNLATSTDHVEEISDLAYGELDRQKLDIYVPTKIKVNDNSGRVLVVFFYGGAWDSGSKEKYKFIASSLTKHGYTVAIPDYRIYPNVKFPTFVEDAALAIAWLQNNHEQYFSHVERIYLMGHSAGAHIASLLISDDQYLKNVQVSTANLAGFIGIAGPYNFLPLRSKKLKKIFPKELRRSSQPIYFIDGNEAPFLLLHGKKDTTVVPENSKSLAEEIKSKNGNVKLRLYENTSHTKIIAPFVRGFENSAPTLQDIVSFINLNNRNDVSRLHFTSNK